MKTFRITFKYGNDPRGTVRSRLVSAESGPQAIDAFHEMVGAQYLAPDAYLRFHGLEEM